MTFYSDTGLHPLHKQHEKKAPEFHHQIHHTKDEKSVGKTHPNCLE